MEAVRSATRTPVSVLGATGYTGVELLRILAHHPAVELVHLSSEQYRGRLASEVYPFLSGIVDETLGAPEPDAAAAGELIFLALPHGAAASLARDLLRRGRRVIDLSPDFRLRDAAVHTRWYGDHGAPELLSEAVYGVPELYRDRLRRARLVANPGCYPTAALLGLAPLARAGLLSAPVVIVFVPHLLPVSRGILTTMYVRVPGGEPPLDSLFEQAYSREPFIVLRGAGPPPELREVRGTNRCAIGWRWDEATQHAIVVTAIDNLGKGAAGQAVQCLNVLLGLPETTGLEAPALVP